MPYHPERYFAGEIPTDGASLKANNTPADGTKVSSARVQLIVEEQELLPVTHWHIQP